MGNEAKAVRLDLGLWIMQPFGQMWSHHIHCDFWERSGHEWGKRWEV